MEDFTATRPSAVIVLDLESEADVVARVRGRRVDMATGPSISCCLGVIDLEHYFSSSKGLFRMTRSSILPALVALVLAA